MRKTGLIYLLFLTVLSHAQIDGFEYDFEQPVQVENSVLIKWTLISGSTCNGTSIGRSTDSIHYEVIGGIDGVCGSANFNISYDFTDNSPVPNTRNYYRLEFGRVGFSETLSVFVVILDADGVLVIPNPVTDKSVIHFKNSQNKSFVLSLYDYNGKQVRQEQNLTQEKHEFKKDGLPPGVYFFQLASEGDLRASGRIIVL